MSLKNTEETYGLIHQLLHWSVAVLILMLLPMGVFMHELPEASPQDITDKVWLYSFHKTLGITVFALAVVRIIWAHIQPHPRPLHGGMEGFAAKTVHFMLYGAIIFMPLMGWFHHAAAKGFAPIWWPFSQDLPFIPKSVALSGFFATAHFVVGVLLVISLFLHIAGAFKHVFIDRDRTMARMLPGRYKPTGELPPEQPKSASPLLAALAAFAIAVAATFTVNAVQGEHDHSHDSTHSHDHAHEHSDDAHSHDEDSDMDQEATDKGSTDNATSDGAWVIDYDASTLMIEVAQMGTPIEGTFSDWSADVVFDPDNLDTSTIRAEVATASLSLGEVSERAVSDEFLGAGKNPTARFISDTITKTDAGFAASGKLTLAGVEKDFIIDFTFDESDGDATVSGEATIQRLDFGIGSGFADGSSVGTTIGLKITIEASRP